MDSSKIHGNLLLSYSTFENLDIRNAHVGGQLSLQQANVTRVLRLHGALIQGSVIMRAYETTEGIYPGMGEANFKHIDLVGARIGRQLNLQGAHVSGEARMERVEVEEGIFFRDTQFDCEVDLMYASIGNSLDLRGATLRSLNLTGARIGHELRLAVGERSGSLDRSFTSQSR